jgi:hypothetical protein
MIDLSSPVQWTAAAQILVSVIGFFFVGRQVLLLGRNTRGSAQDRLYAHYTEVCKLFMQNPHLRPYFYDNMPVPENDPKLRGEVDAMCEAIWGLIEHSVVQKCNLPDDGWRGCWLPYARERIEKSRELTGFFDLNAGWYTHALRETLREIRREPSAAPTPTIPAHGFPALAKRGG